MNQPYATAPRKQIALIAHDNMKDDLLAWATTNRKILNRHSLVATGSTGSLLEAELALPIRKMLSGPLGGDLQIGALIATGGIDVLIFFWDPLEAQPHDPDIRALLRLAQVWNIPVASNQMTADFLISSPLMDRGYQRNIPEFSRPRAGR